MTKAKRIVNPDMNKAMHELYNASERFISAYWDWVEGHDKRPRVIAHLCVLEAQVAAARKAIEATR